MGAPKILAIDFSKRATGIAFGRPGQKPVLSSVSFAKWEGATVAEAASAIIRWLPEALATFQPELVTVEAALPPIASRDETSARLALGFDFLIKGACNVKGIRCIEVHGGTWKSLVLGSGNLPTAEAKKRSLAVCRGMGLEPKSNDESDAYCVWLYSVLTHAKFNDNQALSVIAKLQMKLVA